MEDKRKSEMERSDERMREEIGGTWPPAVQLKVAHMKGMEINPWQPSLDYF